jgi:O-antigen polysaccharide polymerase Wzy
MNTMVENLFPRHTMGLIALNVLAWFAFACSPFGSEYPLAAVGILAFVLVQTFLPACRIRIDIPVCPLNIAQGFYWIQLALVPVLIGYFGLTQGTLPCLPGEDALNTAILIHIVGYLSFCVACQCFNNPGCAVEEPESRDACGTAYLIIPFAILGLLGFVFTYGGITEFIEYASSPLQRRLRAAEPTTIEAAAGSILRHFLGFAVVLAWSQWLGATRRSKMTSALVTVAVALSLLIANFSFNRGTLFGPFLALAAAFSQHVWRIPFRGVALLGGLALSAAFLFGEYRALEVETSDLSLSAMEHEWQPESIVDFVQVYTSAPQLPAYMIERVDQEGTQYRGATLLPSLVYPIPVLGKPFREKSGVFIFNEFIYGDPEVLDQVLPLDAELYVNFHIPGVVVGNILLGWGLCFFQRQFLHAANLVESYSWMLLALFTIFPGSLPVASQLYVYSFWPIYVYMLVKNVWPYRVPARPEVEFAV